MEQYGEIEGSPVEENNAVSYCPVLLSKYYEVLDTHIGEIHLEWDELTQILKSGPVLDGFVPKEKTGFQGFPPLELQIKEVLLPFHKVRSRPINNPHLYQREKNEFDRLIKYIQSRDLHYFACARLRRKLNSRNRSRIIASPRSMRCDICSQFYIRCDTCSQFYITQYYNNANTKLGCHNVARLRNTQYVKVKVFCLCTRTHYHDCEQSDCILNCLESLTIHKVRIQPLIGQTNKTLRSRTVAMIRLPHLIKKILCQKAITRQLHLKVRL